MAIDSNRYTDFVNGVQEAIDRFQRAREIVLPLIVLGELRSGFRAGRRAQANEAELAQFLQSSRVRVLSPDEQTTHIYADLYYELRRCGTPIPTSDMWIAALVIQHGLVLFTRDRHFEAVPQIARI